MKRIKLIFLLATLLSISEAISQPRTMELLDRGMLALERSGDIYLSWRMFGTEPADVGYHVYRDGVKITSSPITTSTNYVDAGGNLNSTYAVTAVISGQEGAPSSSVSVWVSKAGTSGSYPYKSITLPAAPTDPDFPTITYVPGDMNVGDLDGDGDYELVYEWESGNGNETHLSFIDAIDLDGNLLWRVDAGRNCDKLAHIVYDLDMDGKAEVAFKSAPGSKDGLGNYLSKGPAATDDDTHLYARSSGRLVEDPAYITILDGQSGAEKETVLYPFMIGPNGGLDDGWGDNYGHRASSIKACVIWVQGVGPSLVYTRGIYERMALSAYVWNGISLNQTWIFDTNDPQYTAYESQGNHSLSVGDVDNDGSDEIIYGACAIDHDGTGLYTTGFGHGDADHLADHDPTRPGLEFFQPHEDAVHGISMRDAGTGQILWEYGSTNDVGRAWAADVLSEYNGSEISCYRLAGSGDHPNYDKDGNLLSTNHTPWYQPVYWDGDVLRELRDGDKLDKPLASGSSNRLITFYRFGASYIHGSKKDANLVADILGDWREEVIFKNGSNTELLIFSTTIETSHKNYTLMHDPMYRMNVARQNIGYNQPAHTGYYFADGAPVPNIITPGGSGGGGGNQLPIANAGPDQTITDSDENGVESVTLDGSGSTDLDGSIMSYIWTEGATQIATGVNPSVSLAVGVHTITLTVEDDSAATASDIVEITVQSPAPPSNDWFESECAILGPLWNTVTDANASNGSAVTIAPGNSTLGTPPGPDGHITINFNLAESGTYIVWGRVITPTDVDDSFWVQMDGGTWIKWNDIAPGSSWHWDEVHDTDAGGAVVNFSLSAGSHTLTIGQREDGAQLDKIYITKAGDTPSGVGSVAGNCGPVNNPPVANAGADQSATDSDGNGAESFTLDGTASSDSDGTIVSYSWAEGGTEIATGASPAVSLGVGVHTITLTVTDDGGATGSDDVIITVNANAAPTANAGSDQTLEDTDGNGSESVTLNGAASADSDGTIVSYSWSEGATQIATGVNPTVSLSVGAHTITLTVTDNGGAIGSDDVIITVNPANVAPTASFTYSASGLVVDFDGSGSSDSDGTIASYSWDFGDSNSGTGQTPNHTYASAGDYTVVLTVTDNDGATGTDSQVVSVVASSTLTIQENDAGFCLVDGSIDSNHSGYTGSGFANTSNQNGNGIEWAANTSSVGTYTLVWRYAIGGNNARNARVLVNGTEQIANVDFPATGGWSSWAVTSSVSVTLAAGNNTIRLEATGNSGLGNVDYIELTGASPQQGSCGGGARQGGTADLTDQALKLYPNPVLTGAYFSVSDESGIQQVSVYNVNGQLIKQIQGHGVKELQVKAAFGRGLYLIQIVSGEHKTMKKLMIE